MAQALTVVPGKANPNLAGRADGYACCNGDSAPAQAAVQAAVAFSAGNHLLFTVSGFSNYSGDPGENNPDGNQGPATMTNFGDGISAPSDVRWNALMGVFLGPASPTGSSTPPILAFGNVLNFASLSPAIGQIFFIGDGLTSDSNAGDFSGVAQHFVVPTGATRLFLGSSDGSGWYNNSGVFSVQISAVPEPATWALWAAALGSLGMRIRKRRVG